MPRRAHTTKNDLRRQPRNAPDFGPLRADTQGDILYFPKLSSAGAFPAPPCGGDLGDHSGQASGAGRIGRDVRDRREARQLEEASPCAALGGGGSSPQRTTRDVSEGGGSTEHVVKGPGCGRLQRGRVKGLSLQDVARWRCARLSVEWIVARRWALKARSPTMPFCESGVDECRYARSPTNRLGPRTSTSSARPSPEQWITFRM